MPFDTSLLDQALAERRARCEKERQALLVRLLKLLDERAAEFGIDKVYIFGSLIKENRFREHSDIDVVVESMVSSTFFSFAAMLDTTLGREVDVIPLDRCHFADNIRREAIVWTKSK